MHQGECFVGVGRGEDERERNILPARHRAVQCHLEMRALRSQEISREEVAEDSRPVGKDFRQELYFNHGEGK